MLLGLAILGGRIRDQLEEVHLTNLDRACVMAANVGDDIWTRGRRADSTDKSRRADSVPCRQRD